MWAYYGESRVHLTFMKFTFARDKEREGHSEESSLDLTCPSDQIWLSSVSLYKCWNPSLPLAQQIARNFIKYGRDELCLVFNDVCFLHDNVQPLTVHLCQLSLHLSTTPWKHIGGVKVKLYSFYTSELDRREQSVSWSAIFSPMGRIPHSHWLEGSIVHRYSKKKKPCLWPMNQTPTGQLTVSHFTDSVIKVHNLGELDGMWITKW
jgi:hypothetical protein